MEYLKETYTQQKRRHSAELNAFAGIFFAFNEEQFCRGLTLVGLIGTREEAAAQLISLGVGTFIRKDCVEAFRALTKKHRQERRTMREDKKKMFDALVYELRNHEYGISYEVEPALEALSMTRADIDPEMLHKACTLAEQVD